MLAGSEIMVVLVLVLGRSHMKMQQMTTNAVLLNSRTLEYSDFVSFLAIGQLTMMSFMEIFDTVHKYSIKNPSIDGCYFTLFDPFLVSVFSIANAQ